MSMKTDQRAAARKRIILREVLYALGLMVAALLPAIPTGVVAADWQPLSGEDAKLVFAHPDFDGTDETTSLYMRAGRGKHMYLEFRVFETAGPKAIAILTYQESNRDNIHLQYMSMEEVVQYWFSALGEASKVEFGNDGKTEGLMGNYRFIVFSVGPLNCACINHRWGSTMSAVVKPGAHGKNQTHEVNAFYCSPEPMTAVRDVRLNQLVGGVGVKRYQVPVGPSD